METKDFYKTLQKKDEVEIRILLEKETTLEELKDLFEFYIEKKTDNRYIVRYNPKTKEEFEVIYSPYSGSFYDEEKGKSYKMDKYNFWVNGNLKFQLKIIYPYKFHCFQNDHQKTFVIFK